MYKRAFQEAKITLMTSTGIAVTVGEDGSIGPSTEGTSELLTRHPIHFD